MKKAAFVTNLVRIAIILSSAIYLWYLRGIEEWSIFFVGFLLIWLDYQSWLKNLKDKYLTRKNFGDFFRYWGAVSVVVVGYLIALPFFGLKQTDLLRIYFSLILVFVGVFLPIVIAEILAAYYQIFENVKVAVALKQIFPYHRVFIKIWAEGDLSTKYELLFGEPLANVYPEKIKDLLTIWLNIGELSPLSIIRKEYRSSYKFLQLSDQSKEKILEIENVDDKPEQLVITVKTEGDLIAENLLSGKARAKLYEYYAYNKKPVKAISYNPTSRQIVFQFFLNNQNIPPVILELVQKLELGFTELDIKNSLNLYPQFDDYEVIDEEPARPPKGEKLIYSIKLLYKLPSGLPIEKISENRMEALASYIRRPLYQHRLRPYDDKLELYVELATRNMSKLKYTDFPAAEGLRIALGFDLKYRKPVYINFDQAEVKEGDPGFTPHLLIAGATASGKSSFIKFMIMQLLRSHTPDTLRFFMVDPKVVTFKVFQKLPHLYAPIVSDAEKFQLILSGIVDEVERRYRILAESDVENLYQLQNKCPDKALKMPRIMVIVDEFADIIDSHAWKVREQIIMTLKRLGQKARAAGIHLILITQRATSTNIDSEVKANISGRISFKVASEGDSQVILEDPIAADLENPGEGYARLGDSDELVHFQAPYVSDNELKDVMHKYEGIPQDFLDKTLTEEILKKPLKSEEVKITMLPDTRFPIVPIGINLESHKPVFLMLTRPEIKSSLEPTPHVIVAGATNSGKSQFAKLLIQRIALSGGPDLVKMILVDPKAVSFVGYKKLPHLACPVVTKHNQLLPLIKEMLKIIEERYILFAEKEVENIEDYRAKLKTPLCSYLMIIDEFADLLDFYDYKERDEIEKILKRFGQMARAAGIHLIIITQRATSQNISGEIRTNFSGRMAFRMNSEADSFYILEEAGAENLESAGHFLIKKAHYPVEKGYSPMLSEEEILQTVTKLLEKYGPAKFEARIQEAIRQDEQNKLKDALKW